MSKLFDYIGILNPQRKAIASTPNMPGNFLLHSVGSLGVSKYL